MQSETVGHELRENLPKAVNQTNRTVIVQGYRVVNLWELHKERFIKVVEAPTIHCRNGMKGPNHVILDDRPRRPVKTTREPVWTRRFVQG
jgi:hypothetical protein